MSKRFPIPAFDYERFKNMDWAPPTLLSPADRTARIGAARAGQADALGGCPVAIDAGFCERFKLRGPNLHAVMCVLPQQEVKLVGRSHAWAIQQALIVDSLDAANAKVLHDWKTPRPMNTRLGPEDGVTLPGGVVYAVCSHRYADHWIVNRTLLEDRRASAAPGFAILCAYEDSINDFHACNLTFSWA